MSTSGKSSASAHAVVTGLSMTSTSAKASKELRLRQIQ